jgi:hypothetical protein
MGTIKLLLGILVIVGLVLGLFQVAPPLMANLSFQDDLRTIALVDGNATQKTDDEIRNDVLRKVRDHELPIDAKQIVVQRLNSPGIAAVYIAVDYTVPIKLPGYSFDMHFNPDSGNK